MKVPTTTVYAFDVSLNDRYAELRRHHSHERGPNCPACDSALKTERQTKCSWDDDGGEEIGDFVNAGAMVVVRKPVGIQLRSRFDGLSLGRVTLQDRSKSPPLCFLRPDRLLPLDSKSTVDIEWQCPKCGKILVEEIRGIEDFEGTRRRKRTPGGGFLFDRGLLCGDMIFGVRGMGYVLCTQGVKDYVEHAAYTNVRFREVGEFVAPSRASLRTQHKEPPPVASRANKEAARRKAAALRKAEQQALRKKLQKLAAGAADVTEEHGTHARQHLPGVREYLSVVGFDPTGRVRFAAAVQFRRRLYYVWEFKSRRVACYATFSPGARGATEVGCDENRLRLSPAEFVVATHLRYL